MNPTTYQLIMKTIIVTIWLNLRMLPTEAQVPLILSMSNHDGKQSLSQSLNSTPPPPENGAPDNRSDAATHAVKLSEIKQ